MTAGVETENDEVLWRAIMRGDARLFGVIWDRRHGRVFRHFLKLGFPATESEDLSATVFLELWRRRNSVRFVDGSMLPWLLATANNVGRNASRAKRRHQAFLAKLPPPQPYLDPTQHDPGELSALGALQPVWQTARPVDRQLLSLTAIEGFTIAEAATALGISESAAKMRLSRLKSKLRSAIKPTPVSAASRP